MSRPLKKGLTYFPLDVDIFDDDKLFDVQNEFGPIGEVIYLRLLCLIYKNGYYYEFESLDKLAAMLMKSIGTRWARDKQTVVQVIPFLAECNLLSSELMQKNVLTSASIQRRYLKATERRQSLNNLKYILIDEDGNDLLNAHKTRINVDNNAVNVCNNSINVCSNAPKESKEKKSKVNQIKEESIDAKASIPPSICKTNSKANVSEADKNKKENENKIMIREERYIDASASRTLKFIKPSIQDIRAYCLERRNNIDPEVFFDFYESKNWMIGKSKMKDWRAAVRTWEKRQVQEKKEEIKNPYIRKLIEINEHERNGTGFLSDIFNVSNNVES